MNNSNTNQAEQLRENAVMQAFILPNELRLGIYLQELTSNDVFQVDKSFYVLLEFNLECSNPIPLTEEWLLKFGFCENENIFWNEFSVFKNTKNTSVGLKKDDFYFFVQKITINIKHVHQLQNLYFSLTGRELTVA